MGGVTEGVPGVVGVRGRLGGGDDRVMQRGVCGSGVVVGG